MKYFRGAVRIPAAIFDLRLNGNAVLFVDGLPGVNGFHSAALLAGLSSRPGRLHGSAGGLGQEKQETFAVERGL